MEIEILDKNTLWIKKVRNGCWRVMRGTKKVTEHSMREGAERMLEAIIKRETEARDQMGQTNT